MRAFIYTGGTVYPDFVREKPEEDDLVIAADAGLLNAEKCGAAPSVVLGDFDSLKDPKIPEGAELLRFPPEKNETDTQLAVGTALARGANELVIVGGMEGRLDHTLSSLAVLEDLYAKHVPTLFTNGKNRVRFFRDSGVILTRGQYRYFSVLAVDPVIKGVSIEGCKYPLTKAKLTREKQWAVSNEIQGNCALIEVKKGAVYVIESTD